MSVHLFAWMASGTLTGAPKPPPPRRAVRRAITTTIVCQGTWTTARPRRGTARGSPLLEPPLPALRHNTHQHPFGCDRVPVRDRGGFIGDVLADQRQGALPDVAFQQLAGPEQLDVVAPSFPGIDAQR